MSERVMESGWNGANGASGGHDAWPLPVECLMNGLIPTGSADPHLAFFNNAVSLPIQFRHRFAHAGVHISGYPPAQMGVHGHGGPINSNLAIPSQHSMVESSDPSVLVSSTSSNLNTANQDAHSRSSGLNHHHNIEESEDGSDDEEEDVSEEDLDEPTTTFAHPHDSQRQVSISSMPHPSLSVDEDSLPSCQHGQQQTAVINGDPLQQSNLLPVMDDSCHHKANHLSNGLSHLHSHENEIPTLTHGHPLNSNPISAIPMITGNPLLMSDNAEDDFSENIPPPNQHQNENLQCESSSGESVHGKMYVEGRVVFHLKQWTDSGFGPFNSCREQHQQKNKNQRCAFCRHLRISNRDSCRNGLKEPHRHQVKGVFSTFEDCITVELYVEDTFVQMPPQSLDPKQLGMNSSKMDNMPMTAYLNHPVDTQETHLQPNINPEIPLSKPNVEQPGVNEPEPEEQHWWDFRMASQRTETEEETSPVATNMIQEPCIMNLKLNSQPLNHSYQPNDQEIEDKSMESTRHESPLEEYSFKDKCDRCSLRFSVNGQYETHQCVSAITGTQPDSVTSLEIDFSVNNAVNHSECSDISSRPLPEEQEPELEKDQNILAAKGNDDDDCNDDDNDEDNDIDPDDDAISSKFSPEKDSKTQVKYNCPACSSTFEYKKMLRLHLEESHPDDNPYKCHQCKTQFGDESRLNRHSCTLSVQKLKQQQNHNDFPETPVDLTSQEPPSDKEFDEKESDKDMGENSCENQILSDEDSHNHNNEEEIGNENEIQPVGTARTKRKAAKRQNKAELANMRRHSVNSDDSNSSESSLDLRDELEDDSGGNETDQKHSARVTRSDSKRNPRLASEPRSKKGFRCNICGKCFTVERRLINHKTSHKTDRSSQCEKCGKRFARKDKLMRHMYVHNEEKMFACDICEKRFSRRDKLSDHLKSHGTDEIHNCPMCQKQFLRPDILKQHVKLHRMGNKHQCPECLRFVTGLDRLEKHMARHEEAKALGQTLLCPLCTKYFIQRQSLKAHIKKFHPDALYQLEPENGQGQGSPSSSNGSSEETNKTCPTENKLKTKKSRVTTVSLLLEDVMGSRKSVSNKPKPFSCHDCGQKFARKQALKKHSLIKHKSFEDAAQGSKNTKKKKGKSKNVLESLNLKDRKLQKGRDSDSKSRKGKTDSSVLSSSSTSASSVMSASTGQEANNQERQETLLVQDTGHCSAEMDASKGPSLFSHPGGSILVKQSAQMAAYSHHLALSNLGSVASGTIANAVSIANSIHDSFELRIDSEHPQQIHSALSLPISQHQHHHPITIQTHHPEHFSSYISNYHLLQHFQ